MMPVSELPKRRILILGGDRSALAAVRALSRRGYFVGVARHDSDSTIAAASKHADVTHVVVDPQQNLDQFAKSLAEIVAAFEYEVLLPAADDYLAGVTTVRDRLGASVPLAGEEAVLRSLDKLGIEPVAHAAGFATPRTVPATSEAIHGWTGPAIVKDRSHWRPGRRSPGRAPSALTDEHDRMSKVASEIVAHGGQPVLQSPVGGRMHCVGAFRSPDGTVSGWIHQSSDHIWPLPMGTTSRATTLPPDLELRERLSALLDSLEWVGMANLQLFRQEDGRDVLIDFNGRFNHSLALAIAAGVDFPYAWAKVGLGSDREALPDARIGVTISMLVPDIQRALVERRGGLFSDLFDTLRVTAVSTHSILSFIDPLPAVHYLRAALRRREPHWLRSREE